MKKVYLGCGKDRKQGYLHGDIRPLEDIDFVCQAWELSQHEQEFDEIFSRHMFEHLPIAEITPEQLIDWRITPEESRNRVYLVHFSRAYREPATLQQYLPH